MKMVEIVCALLLDLRLNPFVNNGIALCMSAWNGHVHVVRALLDDSRIDLFVAKRGRLGTRFKVGIQKL
jgi:hypothetical protein